MFKIIIKLIFLLFLSSALFAKDGLSQTHLLSVSSQLSSDSVIEIKFNLPIIEDSFSKRSIVVKHKGKKIKGSVGVKNKNILTFTPKDALQNTSYKVKVKPLKLLDLNSKNKTRFQKMAYKMCSWFYDDVKQCNLYRFAHTIKTKKIKFTLKAKDAQVKIISLKLTKDKVGLADDSITTIDAIALYDNNTTKTLTNEVEWLIGDESIISVDKKTITPLKEGITTLQAKYNKQLSQIIEVEIYKEINGYKLPPMPDETLNNSTLLGIDSNNNGVRDDVERWIFETYKEPIVQAVALQGARASQIIITDPSKAKETTKYMENLVDCLSYYKYQDDRKLITRNSKIYQNERVILFNTRERSHAYYEYNQALSGGVYPGRDRNTHKTRCDFNATKVERGEW